MRHLRTCLLATGLLLIALASLHGESTPAPSPTPAQSPAPAPTATPSRPLVFVAIYERGPAWDDTKGAFAQTGINDHMQHLRANAGKLVAAAPFEQALAPGAKDHTIGMLLIAAASQQEAEALTAADPAIAGHLMTVTVRRWLVDRIKAY